MTVNTDNRLMSGVTLSSEFARLAKTFGYGWSDIEWLTINAMKSAFAHFDQRLRIINTVIKPGRGAGSAARQNAIVLVLSPDSFMYRVAELMCLPIHQDVETARRVLQGNAS